MSLFLSAYDLAKQNNNLSFLFSNKLRKAALSK